MRKFNFLLFLTNLVCIVFFGGLVFIFQSYGDFFKAKQGLLFSVITLAILALPLSLSMRSLLTEKNLRFRVREIVTEETKSFSSFNIESIRVTHKSDSLRILIEVYTPSETLSKQKIDRVGNLLAEELEQPIELIVRAIPVNNYKYQNLSD